MEETIVLYPATGRGHVNSAVEFAKLLLLRFPAVTITVVVLPSTDIAYYQSVSSAIPSITILCLPPAAADVVTSGVPAVFYQIPLHQNPNLRNLLSELATSKTIKALFVDFFCNAAVRVAGELGIKCYFYFTSCLASLALFLYFPEVDKESPDSPVQLPGLPPVSPADVPAIMTHRSGEAYPHVLDTARNMRNCAGIVVNSFESLEANALRAIVDGRNRTTLNSDLNEILPPGFMNRTQERGFVVKQWAPQVLNHESVGGFVTHCGWNSVLESLCAGVPMVGWPLYADQKLANHFMVLEMRVALELKMDESPLAVTADELAKRVTELMTETVSGKAVRDRVAAMKEEAVAAISDGGSSDVALTKLVESLKRA
ncbi:UDP-glycosyltransferase 13 [Linum perenne]